LNIKICVSVDKKASASGRLRPQTRYQGIALNPTGDPALRYIQCESKNPPPLRFSENFPKRLGIFNQFLHTYYAIFSTLYCKFLFKYLQQKTL